MATVVCPHSSLTCTNRAYVHYGPWAEDVTKEKYKAGCIRKHKRGVRYCCKTDRGIKYDGWYYFCEPYSAGHLEYSSSE